MRTAQRARFRDVATLLSSLIWIGGCGLLTTPPPQPAPTLSQIGNATYAGVLEPPVSLQDGSYVGAPFVEGESRPAVLLWSELIAFGDLDGSPGDEAAVLLSGTSGGSGERVYLAVVGVRDGQAVNLGTTLVGDRVKIRALSIVGRDIALDLVEPGEKDAACCPTQLAHRIYWLDNAELRLVSTDPQGTLSVRALEGTAWQLVWLDEHAPPSGLRPPTLTLKNARLNGFSGCNTYTGTIEESAPGEVKVSALAGTRMACEPAAMNVEQEFLRRLEKVDRYTFLAGRLALSGARRDDRFLLLLTAKVPEKAEK